jgi:hypothetical protein
MEILTEIIGGLIIIFIVVTLSWIPIFKLLNQKKYKRAFIILNIVTFALYMSYCIYGRFNWSEYGNSLVWEFYAAVLPIIHTTLLLVTTILLRPFGKSKI